MKRRHAWMVLATTMACGDGGTVVQTGDGSGGSSSADATTTGDTTTSSSATSMSPADSSSSSDEADVSSDGTTASLPDLPPYPAECDAPVAFIDVTSSMTPEGPMTVHEAWISSDACGQGPFVVLSQTPTIEAPQAVEVAVTIEAGLRDGPLLGEYPAYIWGDGEATGTITLIEPFNAADMAGVPQPDEHLHAQIEFHSGGYDLSLEVDLIDCGIWNCYCPCR